MRLSSLHEAKRLDSNELSARLRAYRPFNAKHAISLVASVADMPRIKSIARHAGWQVHSASTGGTQLYIDVTPLKNARYDGDTAVLYHVTSREQLPDIMRRGLQLRSQTPGMRFPRRVYLYPTIGMAVARARMADKLGMFANKRFSDPVILKIDNSAGTYGVFLDPENYLGMGHNADDPINVPVYTSKRVRPADITVVPH